MNVHRSYRAFSLVELVMVVATMGVIAAIAAPRMSSAATSANAAAAIANIQVLDSAVEMYAAEHDGQSPALDSDGKPVDATLLVKRLIATSDEDGDSPGIYGPYLHTLPRNPGNYLRTVRVDGALAGSGDAGWRFDTETGGFLPDDPAHVAAVLKIKGSTATVAAGKPLGEEEP